MLTFLIIFFTLTILFFKEYNDYGDTFLESSFKSIIISGLISPVITFLISIFVLFFIDLKYEKKIINCKELYALKDEKSINGDFFLGTGGFGEKMKYYYYSKEYDLYNLEECNAKNAKIKYTEENPKVCTIVYDLINGDKYEKWLFIISKRKGGYEKIFYVPEGSIKKIIELDLN